MYVVFISFIHFIEYFANGRNILDSDSPGSFRDLKATP